MGVGGSARNGSLPFISFHLASLEVTLRTDRADVKIGLSGGISGVSGVGWGCRGRLEATLSLLDRTRNCGGQGGAVIPFLISIVGEPRGRDEDLVSTSAIRCLLPPTSPPAELRERWGGRVGLPPPILSGGVIGGVVVGVPREEAERFGSRLVL